MRLLPLLSTIGAASYHLYDIEHTGMMRIGQSYGLAAPLVYLRTIFMLSGVGNLIIGAAMGALLAVVINTIRHQEITKPEKL